MSLKHFHIVFILLAVLAIFGFAAWALLSELGSASSSIRLTGWLSVVLGVVLSVYVVWFYRKSKHVIT
jgi:ABC-type iron transport system FetAB permease component